MGLRGFFDALTKIAAQPDKNFGELVRRRRRKRGLPVAPASKVLPFLPARRDDSRAEYNALDMAAENLLGNVQYGTELHAAQLRLAEGRLDEALKALEASEMCTTPAHELTRLELIYSHTLSAFEVLATPQQPDEKV